jgi:predicted ArsR family transcriptional regulator
MSSTDDVEAMAVVAEPQRRRILDHLHELHRPASLTEIADDLGLGRTLVAFHLGKLVDAGLAEVLAAVAEEGRRGRPSQRYRASDRELSVSVPERHYELVAEVLLAAAAEKRDDESTAQAARRVGRARGVATGERHRPSRSPRTSRSRWSTVQGLLRRLGYAPATRGHEVVLRNCPFDRLRDTNCALVCGINHALTEGYLEGLGLDDTLSAELRPCEDACCVVVTASD